MDLLRVLLWVCLAHFFMGTHIIPARTSNSQNPCKDIQNSLKKGPCLLTKSVLMHQPLKWLVLCSIASYPWC